ncbi:hypothetical protein [Salinicola socius]|nr:hypothetical protein [Salinicola socius]
MSVAGRTIRLGEPLSLMLPSIGCGVWLDRLFDLDPTLERLSRQLEAVAPRHLDVLLDLRDPLTLERLAGLMSLASERRVAIWLYVVCEDSDPGRSLAALARRLESVSLVPAGMLVTPAAYLKSHQPDGDWPSGTSPDQALAAARPLWPELTLGGGVPTYFTELNRCRPDPTTIDFITHAVSPIVHAADDRSVMETLESLPDIVASCRALAPDVPYRITTTAIGAWTNPYGEKLTPNDGTQRVTLSDNDPRQSGLFAAAWAVGFVARVACAGVDAVTLSSLGPPFDIGADHLYPVGHVIAGLARASGRPLRQLQLEHPLTSLAWQTESSAVSEVWIANLSADAAPLYIEGVDLLELSRLDAMGDGFQPAPSRQACLRAGGTDRLAGFEILRLRVQCPISDAIR